MTQWCATAAGTLTVIFALTTARYCNVTRALRTRLGAKQQELDALRAQLDAGLAHRDASMAEARREQEISAATRRAFLSVARRILVMAHEQQAGLDEMERTHDDPALLEGLLKADHAAAQQARLAQTLAVLCGARAGRHWPEPVTLEDVVRGAQSRILPFQRVVIRSRIDTAVVGAAAEALIHAMAELLDNATRYSPPSTQVYVTLSAVRTGVVLEIDDCGVGMTEQAAERAAAVLSGGGTLEVHRLGEVPQLGLAAVGRLAEEYGFRVTVSKTPSPYGGVRVVVLLPTALLTEPLPTPSHLSSTPVPPKAVTPGARRPLPRRTNRRSDEPPRRQSVNDTALPARSAQAAQDFMALFQSGTADGRAAAQRHQPDPRRRAADPYPPTPSHSPHPPQHNGEFYEPHP